MANIYKKILEREKQFGYLIWRSGSKVRARANIRPKKAWEQRSCEEWP